MARTLRSTSLAGPAGPLEALLDEPKSSSRIGRAVVVCHPHPQYGGTMHNKVVYRMARGARRAGAAVLRFNFRGVGASSGTYDAGRGEQDDLRAAMRYMQERHPGVPLVVGGFSFGSRVSLRVCCSESSVDRVIAVGLPVNRGDFSFLGHCACPKHFIHSTQDQYGSRRNLELVLEAAAEPCGVTWIDARDHFFSDALDALEEAVRDVLREG